MKTNQYISGFTLIEMIITLIISSSLFLGMMNITAHITKNIERDSIYEDVKHYSTQVMSLISEDIKDADSIKVNSFFGKWEILILNKKVTENGIEWDQKIYRENTEYGMLFNDRPILSSGFGIFNNEKYDITLEFIPKCSERTSYEVLNFSDTAKNNLRTSYFELSFNYSIKLKSNQDQRIIKTIKFNDRIFAQNIFLRSLRDA